MVRSWPNIVLTGTPGTGKTTHSSQLVSAFTGSSPSGSGSPLQHIDVGQLVKDKSFHTRYDEEWQSYEVDEDALLDYLEPLSGGTAPEPIDEGEEPDVADAEGGGLILDWHTCDAWPERWADLVVVLRCDHSKLWERLEKRGYPQKKIQENNEAEIMQVALSDARESYPAEAIVELRSETVDDVEANVERLKEWVLEWRRARGFK